MKTFKRITSLLLISVMMLTAFPLSLFVTAADDNMIIEPTDISLPSGYHFAGKTNIDENGTEIFYIEDEPSEYGLVHEKWIYSDGREAKDPDITPAYDRTADGLDRKNGFPDSYDSRKLGIITPVEFQAGGTCWAHSSISCIETAYLKQGLGSAIDLSEYHTVWYSKSGYYDGITDSKNDGQVYKDINNVLDEGGNTDDISRALMNFSGPVLEKNFPLESVNDSSADGATQPDSTEVLCEMKSLFPYDAKYDYDLVVDKISSVEDSEDAIKQAITDFGAVKASYCSDNTYYTPDYYWDVKDKQPQCFYCPEEKTTNHAITIIGWDDNFSRTNFKSDCRPQNDGAWLVKNSWGKRWGNYGYFWISYEDKTLSTFYVFTLGNADEYEDVYMYDGMGYGASLNANGGANVFTANADEYLTKISYGSTGSRDYVLKIYKNLPSNYKNPTDGTLAYTQSGNLNNERYIDIYGDVSISKGEIFSIVLETSYIYLEGTDYGSQKKTAKFNSAPGESYYLNNLGTWVDASEKGYNNVCIRAIADIKTGDGNYKIKFKDGVKYENVVISNGSTVTLPTLAGNTFVFTYNGKPFDGTGIDRNMSVETHCYPTNGTVDESSPCEKKFNCIFCGKEIKSEQVHDYKIKTVAPSATTVGYTKHTCSNCGDSYFDGYSRYKNAVGGECGDAYWQYYNSNFSIIADGDIPSFESGTSVPWNAYKEKIISLNICEGTKKVGDYAFSGLTNLTKLTLSPDLLIVGNHTFENAAHLKELICPTPLKSVGEYAFSGCTAMSKVSFNDGLISIGSNTFENCNSLIEVEIPGTVISFGSDIFKTCASLKKIVLGEGITYVPSLTWECPLFEELVLPSTFTGGLFANYIFLKKFTFSSENPNFISVDGVLYSKDMRRLVSYPPNKSGAYYDIPDSVSSIDQYAFSHTANLKYLDMSCDVTALPVKLFNQTYSISNINLPAGLTTINDYMFSSVRGITQLYIPSTVKNISPKAMTFGTTVKFTVFTDTNNSAAKAYADSVSMNCTVLHTKHNFSTTAFATEATCGKGGETIKTCSCGCFSYKISEPTGKHTFEWKTDKKATCEGTGLQHEECSVCGAVRSENTVINPLGHSFTGKAVNQGNGTHLYKCLNCEKIGGAPEKCVFRLQSSTPGANCKQVGHDTYACVCGESYTEPNEIYGWHTYKGDTCTTCGYVNPYYKCTCNCHSTNFLTSLFWKIKVFFWKLFGKQSERICDCGAYHW